MKNINIIVYIAAITCGIFLKDVLPTFVYTITFVGLLFVWSILHFFGDFITDKLRNNSDKIDTTDIDYHSAEMYELIKDWDTPITKFYKGHMNTPEVWAKIMGIDVKEFYESLENGSYVNWFKRVL